MPSRSLPSGWWIAEAVMLVVKTLGLYGLLTLSGGTVGAGASASSYETVGSLALGVSQHAADVAMLFFCLGGSLWHSLLLKSRIVPRLLALWGLVTVPLVLVATVMLVWDRALEPSVALYALYVPFELILGLWLLVKVARSPDSLRSWCEVRCCSRQLIASVANSGQLGGRWSRRTSTSLTRPPTRRGLTSTARTKWASFVAGVTEVDDFMRMSRLGARCRDCSRSVSPGRSPNPPCVFPRNGLSTGAAVHGSACVQGVGIV